MKDSLKHYGLEAKDKAVVELLEEIRDQMIEMNEHLVRLLGSRPSPS